MQAALGGTGASVTPRFSVNSTRTSLLIANVFSFKAFRTLLPFILLAVFTVCVFRISYHVVEERSMKKDLALTVYGVPKILNSAAWTTILVLEVRRAVAALLVSSLSDQDSRRSHASTVSIGDIGRVMVHPIACALGRLPRGRNLPSLYEPNEVLTTVAALFVTTLFVWHLLHGHIP